MALPQTTYDLSEKHQRTLNREQMEKLHPTRLLPVLGRAITNALKKHLGGLNASRANKLGGKRSNFYAACSRGTSYEVQPDGVTISVARIGYAQRYFGGTIKPVKAKALTIPVDPLAYGKDPRKMDLFVGQGRRAAFLALVNRSGDTRAAPRVMFLLLKKVTQKADPSVFLSEKAIAATVDDTINKRLSAPK